MSLLMTPFFPLLLVLDFTWNTHTWHIFYSLKDRTFLRQNSMLEHVWRHNLCKWIVTNIINIEKCKLNLQYNSAYNNRLPFIVVIMGQVPAVTFPGKLVSCAIILILEKVKWWYYHIASQVYLLTLYVITSLIYPHGNVFTDDTFFPFTPCPCPSWYSGSKRSYPSKHHNKHG